MDRMVTFCEKPLHCLILLVAASLIVIVLPILIGGLHSSGDLAVYLGFSEELRSAIRSGDLFPGWANDTNGFGSLGIRFYPPLTIYLTTGIDALTNSMYDTIWISFLLCMIVGCLGCYLFVRDWGSPIQAVCAGLIYAIAPFPLAKTYQFTLYSEFAAGSIVPFCFLFVTRICRRREWLDVILLAISFSLLILTHIPTTIVTAISLFIYVILIMEWREFPRALIRLAAAAAISLVATAFYWINVVTEVSWLAHSRQEFSSGMYSFDQWLFPNSVFREVSSYYIQHYRNIDTMIVLMVLTLVPFAVIWLKRGGRVKNFEWKVLSAVTLTAFFALFMTTRASYFVWAESEFLQKIQFPWRWLTIVSVLASISFVLCLPEIRRKFPAYARFIGVSTAGIIVLMMAFDVRQSFARWNRISRAEFQQMQDSKYSNPAWWPIWANAEAFDKPDRVLANGRNVEIARWKRTDRSFEVAKGSPADIRVATFYYPHWQATVNGQTVEVDKDENGAMVIPVGADDSAVRLYFEEPILNKAFSWISLISWLALGLVLLRRLFAGKHKRASPHDNSI